MTILLKNMAATKNAFLTAGLFATAVQGHMIMANPIPYGYKTLDNSPLSSDGSNYPCKVTRDPATFYSTTGIDNTYAAGSGQILSFKGSAVHGGGSCQLAISNDLQPSAETDWRVILSIESGCPTTDGTSPSTYNWTVPQDLAPGQYSFAWTWISKLAGQPEYYMNCAPITVTASSAKKLDNNSTITKSSYPELFVANLNTINSCKTSPGTDPVYPEPGDNVEKLLTGAVPSFSSISAAGCVPLSQMQGLTGLPVATAGGAPTTSAISVASSSSVAMSSTDGAMSGGVSVTTLTQAASSLITSTLSSSTETISVYVSPIIPTPILFNSSSTAPASQESINSPYSAHEPSTNITTSAVQPKVTDSGGSGRASTKSGACANEGMFNCVSSEYQQCASGSWTAMQALPAGTSCTQGESLGLWVRDTRRMLRWIRRDQIAGPAIH